MNATVNISCLKKQVLSMNGFGTGAVPDKSAEVQECEGEVPQILAASEGNE